MERAAILEVAFTSILCLVFVTAHTRRYAKVVNSFPDELLNTFVANFSYPGVNYRFACAQKCNEVQCCNLACIVGDECHLFEHLVADGWPGFGGVGALQYDSCFTSWVTNPRRLRPVATLASSVGAGSDAGRATNGFIGRNIGNCFVSAAESRPWWVADLGTSKRVARVTVMTRRDGVVSPWALELRLGDSSDYSSNSVFASSEQYPSVVVGQMSFAPDQLRSGRFLSLHSLNSDTATVLALCDVQILDTDAEPIRSNCQELFDAGHNTSGIYTIFPEKCCPVRVYCDMETDGGGWTVFQRREDILPREDFYRTWLEYAQGFGLSPCREHWLGLDHIHALTAHGPSELRVHLADFNGASRFAKYSSFSVADRNHEYTLSVGGYSGDAGESMVARQNGYNFSAKDKGLACAVKYRGAWWYGNPCHFSNLNGFYYGGPMTTFADGVNWNFWLGFDYSLKSTVMMVRALN